MNVYLSSRLCHMILLSSLATTFEVIYLCIITKRPAVVFNLDYVDKSTIKSIQKSIAGLHVAILGQGHDISPDKHLKP